MAKEKEKQPAKEASQKSSEELSSEEQTSELSDAALEGVSGGSVVSELFKLLSRRK